MKLLFQSKDRRILLTILLLLLCLFFLFVYYKTRIKKTVFINSNYYIEYIEGDLDVYFLNEAFQNESLYPASSEVSDLTGLFIDEDFIYFTNEKMEYFKADKYILKIEKLKINSIVLIENKKTIVEKINYKSPFWYLVFN